MTASVCVSKLRVGQAASTRFEILQDPTGLEITGHRDVFMNDPPFSVDLAVTVRGAHPDVDVVTIPCPVAWLRQCLNARFPSTQSRAR